MLSLNVLLQKRATSTWITLGGNILTAIICQVVSDMVVVDHHPSPPFNSFASHGDMRTVQLAMVDLGEICWHPDGVVRCWKREKSADGSVCCHNRQVRDAHQ